VGRILAGLDVAAHRVRGWLNRREGEQFWTQAAAVCDVYLRPEPDTMVICIDELCEASHNSSDVKPSVM
jgi:hypothetical protein